MTVPDHDTARDETVLESAPAKDIPLDDRALMRMRDVFAGIPDDDPREHIAHHARYRALDLLGEGGMGTVYRCVDEVLGREVAMKVVRVSSPARQAIYAARLQAESRILARLEHAGIVPIHDAGLLPDGRAFYVMQRLRGRTLRAVLDAHATGRATLPLARRLDLVERITEAVAFAHGQDVIHRDLKPDNVMVGDFGEVHVTDWGVARVLDEAATDAANDPALHDPNADGAPNERLTSAGTVLGTPDYMAPEQAAGLAHTVGPAADVYALGALLVTVITGHAPPSGIEPTRELMALPASADVPPSLRAVALRCLHSDPAQRYQHAELLLEELRRYRSGDRVDAYQEGLAERVKRFLRPWRTAIVLVLAYLIIRIVVAWIGRGATGPPRAP